MSKVLTVKAIEAVRPAAVRNEIPDGGLPGLYFIVQPSGAKSWAVRYRYQGRPRKLTIGPYPLFGLLEARKAGGVALRAAAEGRDPGAEKKDANAARREDADLVEKVFDEFLTRYVRAKNRESSAYETERLIEKEIKPTWRGRRIQSIARRDILAVLDAIVDRGAPYQANRVHALLRKAFNWFLERDIVQATPVANISPPAAEESRDRILTDDEIKSVWSASEAVGWPFGPLVKVLLLTGQRRDEVADAAWSEFDLDASEPTWVIPKERAKNGIAHVVALAPTVVDILRGIPRVKDQYEVERLAFTTTGDTPVSGFSKAKLAIDAKIAESGAKVDAWRFHDLRRTAASGMASLGIPPHIVEKILNHRTGTIRGVAAVYNRHNYGADRRRALYAWADHVDALVGLSPDYFTERHAHVNHE